MNAQNVEKDRLKIERQGMLCTKHMKGQNLQGAKCNGQNEEIGRHNRQREGTHKTYGLNAYSIPICISRKKGKHCYYEKYLHNR